MEFLVQGLQKIQFTGQGGREQGGRKVQYKPRQGGRGRGRGGFWPINTFLIASPMI